MCQCKNLIWIVGNSKKNNKIYNYNDGRHENGSDRSVIIKPNVTQVTFACAVGPKPAHVDMLFGMAPN